VHNLIECTNEAILKNRIAETEEAYSDIASAWQPLSWPADAPPEEAFTVYNTPCKRGALQHIFLVSEPECPNSDLDEDMLWRRVHNQRAFNFIRTCIAIKGVGCPFNLVEAVETAVNKKLPNYVQNFVPHSMALKCSRRTRNPKDPFSFWIASKQGKEETEEGFENGYFKLPFILRHITFIDNRALTTCPLNGTFHKEGGFFHFYVEMPGVQNTSFVRLRCIWNSPLYQVVVTAGAPPLMPHPLSQKVWTVEDFIESTYVATFEPDDLFDRFTSREAEDLLANKDITNLHDGVLQFKLEVFQQ